MLSETNIDNIAVNRFSSKKGDRFSIKSGLQLTFPKANDISSDEIRGINCANCPIYEYRQDTVNTREGSDRRGNIRCKGIVKEEKILGPIHIADHTNLSMVNSLFRNNEVAPCGITTGDFRTILMSSLVGLSRDGIKLGNITETHLTK